MLKCTKIDFDRGSTQYPVGGAYSISQDLLGDLLLMKRGGAGKGGRGRERKETEGRGGRIRREKEGGEGKEEEGEE